MSTSRPQLSAPWLSGGADGRGREGVASGGPASLLKLPFQNAFKGEGKELEALPNVELVLEFHPVQPERVQEGGEALHDEQDADRAHSEAAEDEGQQYEAPEAPGGQADAHHHGPQHLRQLCVRQTKGPQS